MDMARSEFEFEENTFCTNNVQQHGEIYPCHSSQVAMFDIVYLHEMKQIRDCFNTTALEIYLSTSLHPH